MNQPTAKTLGHLLVRAATTDGTVRFLDRRENATEVTYATLASRARRAGAVLADRGVRAGDRVAIILPTGVGFYDAFFGAAMIGAVPVPVYPPVRLGRLDEYRETTARMMRGCRTRIAVIDRRTARAVGATVAEASPDLGFFDADELLATHETSDIYEAAGAEPAFIQHSSGTTGRPKPVRLTHDNLIHNIDAIRTRLLEAYPETEEVDHGVVSWLPLYHDMGLIGCVLTAMAQAVDLTLIPPELFVARPAVWLRAISRYGATVSGAPDFAYSYCASRIADAELDGVDLSSWLVALSGAEPVSVATLERFVERFEPLGFSPTALTPVYGLAEATLAVTFSDAASEYRTVSLDRDKLARGEVRRARGEGAVRLVSVGRPLDGVSLRLVGEADASAPVSPATLGRVQVSGPSVFDGYDDQPADAPMVEREVNAWLDTGDVGFIHEGELFLYSRARDVLVFRGLKYAPESIEGAVVGVEGVREGCVAAVAVPDDSGSDSLVVLAERARGRVAGDVAERVSRSVLARTGLDCAQVIVLDPGVLPRTSSGKIRRAEARRRFELGELVAPRVWTPLAIMREVFRSRFKLSRLRGREASTSG